MKIIRILPLVLIFAVSACTNPSDRKKIDELESKVAQLDSLKNELLAENEMLKENLLQYESEQAEKNRIEKERLEKLRKTSQGLILNDKVQVVTVKTGFDPYHNYDNLWLPTIAIMFQNISERDIIDFIKVRAVFIDNKTGEQIAEDHLYLCTSSRPFVSGTKKQISLKSSVGWYAVKNQNVSVKISIEDDAFKTYKVKNAEFDGRI